MRGMHGNFIILRPRRVGALPTHTHAHTPDNILSVHQMAVTPMDQYDIITVNIIETADIQKDRQTVSCGSYDVG